MRKLSVLGAALLSAMAAVALVVAMSSGSSHREAPLTSIDPTADDTDVYAFVAPDAKDSLTLVSNWIPFEDPAGGPNFLSCWLVRSLPSSSQPLGPCRLMA